MPQDHVPSGSGRPSSGLDNFAGQAGEEPEGTFTPEAIDIRTVDAMLASPLGKRVAEWWTSVVKMVEGARDGNALAFCELAQLVDHDNWRYMAHPGDDVGFWQSPIERALGCAIYVACLEWAGVCLPGDSGVWWMQDHAERNIITSKIGGDDNLRVFIAPQHPVGRYKADFLLRFAGPDKQLLVVVECDGHDFHERTPEQAEHDKKRDRFFTSSGFQVLRFTGREIYRDAMKCASEVVALAGTRKSYGVETYGIEE